MSLLDNMAIKPVPPKFELVKGKTYKLEANKKYMIFVNKRCMSMSEAHSLSNYLYGTGSDGVIVRIDGDPNDNIKVLEELKHVR